MLVCKCDGGLERRGKVEDEVMKDPIGSSISGGRSERPREMTAVWSSNNLLS